MLQPLLLANAVNSFTWRSYSCTLVLTLAKITVFIFLYICIINQFQQYKYTYKKEIRYWERPWYNPIIGQWGDWNDNGTGTGSGILAICAAKLGAGEELAEEEIALLDKKAAKAKERAATKKAEGDELTAQVKDALTEEYQVIADIAATVAESDADATVSKVTYRLGKLVEAGKAEKTQVTIPATEGSKARKVQAYRALA